MEKVSEHEHSSRQPGDPQEQTLWKRHIVEGCVVDI